MDRIEIKYKTNFFSKESKIVFSENELRLYCNNKLMIQIDKEEIIAFRYGVSWIRGIDFYIGRVYCIDISNGNSKVIKIRLRSLYGIHKLVLNKKFNDFLDKLYEFYFDENISNYIEKINSGEAVTISGVIFKKEGVNLDVKKADGFIEWTDLYSRVYTYYYTLSSKKKPDYYKAFTYLKDWNAVILYAVSRQILLNKGLYQESE
ncbi:MAG: hypothetical protein CVU05_02875 [Bacteroidetes bacterium HGW-Bacteroidetes-21]|jgi:hypothetical protein|nr:MAG: hypothetical protein CVU05_02875 [Bacteroidetes bacterium HGW-Bacteroidetes-21]